VKLDLGVGADTALFVFAHHLLASHHPRVLVDAASTLLAEGVDIAVCLLGDGPERVSLIEHVERLGIERRVILPGNVPRARVRELMTSATAVVSLDELSNLVNSVLEAVALGVPVIATATGGTRTLLEDERNALIVENNSDAVAQALRRIADDPQLRSRLSAGAVETAGSKLESWSTRMSQESQMLSDLLT
jgi:glycosyltransferase involved in cell wall biosynthesis